MRHSMKGWILLALVVVGFVIFQAERSTPVAAAAPQVELTAEIGAPLDVPAELQLGDAAQPMACAWTTCMRNCRGRGYCEGECIGNVCRCMIPQLPGGICP